MSFHNYFSVLGEVSGNYLSEDDEQEYMIDLCNEVLGNVDIILKIISNSPWLLVLSCINKTWNNISKNVISKLDFVELCKQNHYPAIRHLLINYHTEKSKLYKYGKDIIINNYTCDTIKKYNNGELKAVDFEDFQLYNKNTNDFEFDQSRKYMLDHTINAIVSYSDGLFDGPLLKDKKVIDAIYKRKNLLSRGLLAMLCNTNNQYTNYMVNLFKTCGDISMLDILEYSLRASNDKVYIYLVKKYPEIFMHTMTTWVFYTANMNIIKFYLNIRNSTDIKIKQKYNVRGNMHENEWQDALYCSLYMDHYEGVRIALKHTTYNHSGVSCDSIRIKDPRIKELVKNIECSVCEKSMKVHFA